MNTYFRFLIVFSSLLFPLSSYAQEPKVEEETPLVKKVVIPKVTLPKHKTIKIVYPRRGCLDGTGTDSISLISPLFSHFSDNRGSVSITSSGFSAFSKASEVFIQKDQVISGKNLEKAIATELTWEKVEEVPVFISPREILFQFPFRGHFNWSSIIAKKVGKGKKFASTKQITGVVFQTTYQGKQFLKLVLDQKADKIRVRSFAAITHVNAPDDAVDFYTVGRRMGRGSRVKPEVEKRLAEGDPGSNILLHFGQFSDVDDEKLTGLCANLMGHLNPMAGVPSFQELALGKEKLKTLDKKQGLRLIAANLVDPKTQKPVFRRFSVSEVNGLTIAVYGLISKDQLERVSASSRGEWEIQDTRLALINAAKELESQLQRKPDLSVVLLSTRNSKDLSEVNISGMDIVIYPTGRSEMGVKETSLKIDPRAFRVRYPFVAQGTGVGVNEIVATFAGNSLTSVTHKAIPIDESFPIDVNVVEAFRKLDSISKEKSARVIIPDIEGLTRSQPNLRPLVWGPEIRMNGHVQNRDKSDPAQFTDALWMRLITNIMKNEVNADLAISRNMLRRSNMVGPINAWMTDTWLDNSDRIGVVTLSGAEVMKLWKIVQSEKESGRFYTAGFEPQKARINGRKIENNNPYKVVVTDYIVAFSKFENLFRRKNIKWKFVKNEKETFVANNEGNAIDTKALAYSRFDKWSDEEGNFSAKKLSDFTNLISEDGTQLQTEYRLRIKDLGLNGALYNNSDNISSFADTRETRLSGPDNYTLGGKLNVDFLIDGKLVGWESGLNAELARIVLDIPGQDIPPQERADDILVFTETRINAVKVNVAEAGMPLIPFIRLEFDSEFTATSNPSEGKDATFPHQKLFNILTGAVLYPGAVLKEIRVAPIAQLDFSGEELRTDFGMRMGYKLNWNIFGPVKFESISSMSYLIPDSDDRSSDLALRMISKNQLVVPVWRHFSIFAFGDLFYAIGKTNVNNSLGGSSIVGAGLKFSDVWRF